MIQHKVLSPSANIQNIHLVYGLMHSDNYCIERDFLETSKKNQSLKELIFAQSWNSQVRKLYVQHVLHNIPDLIQHQLETKGKIFICGSNLMSKDVL